MSLEESGSRADDSRSRTSISAQRLAAQLLDDEDMAFLDGLQKAGLLEHLDEEELLRIASEVEESDGERRRVDLLALYYAAAGDDEVSETRRLADRYFLQSVGEPATASGLVDRLAVLTPELGKVELERIGGGEDGPLVLRAGGHFSAVLDDYEEETDTEEYDLSEAEQRQGGVTMVTVRGLVRALNVLLDRHDVRERLVSLRGDEEREVYVALGVAEAAQLARAGFLEDENAEDMMELAAW